MLCMPILQQQLHGMSASTWATVHMLLIEVYTIYDYTVPEP